MPDDEEILTTVERYLDTMSEGAEVELAFFGGTFTGLPMEEQERLLKLVAPYREAGQIGNIRLSTRPDYITEENVRMLKEGGVGVVELGVQSMDEEVLKASGRGYGVETTERAAEIIKGQGLELGMQMMIGLPKDTKEKSAATARKIVTMGARNTRIYPTLVMKHTMLARWYEEGKYRPLTLEEAVDWTKDLLWIFADGGVLVQRVGLHPTKGLIDGTDYLAGPFHVSFKEMAMTAMWRDVLEKEMRKMKSGGKVVIYVANNMLGAAAGYGGKNRKWLEENGVEVAFRGDEEMEGMEYRLKYLHEYQS